MKKVIESFVFLLVCLILLPFSLSAQGKTEVDFNESNPIEVKDISVYFKPEKMEWIEYGYYSDMHYVEGPYYLEIVDNVVSSVLPYDRNPASKDYALDRYSTKSYREKMNFDLKKNDDGSYRIDVFMSKFHKFKVQHYFSLNIDKEGYGIVTFYRKDSQGSHPIVKYYGEFNCHIVAETSEI